MRKKSVVDDSDVALVPDGCTNTFLKTLTLDAGVFANLLRMPQIHISLALILGILTAKFKKIVNNGELTFVPVVRFCLQ